ncbi:hypothetical protein VUR80DRAFT_5036 [Thermomyces stellatus]
MTGVGGFKRIPGSRIDFQFHPFPVTSPMTHATGTLNMDKECVAVRCPSNRAMRQRCIQLPRLASLRRG